MWDKTVEHIRPNTVSEPSATIWYWIISFIKFFYSPVFMSSIWPDICYLAKKHWLFPLEAVSHQTMVFSLYCTDAEKSTTEINILQLVKPLLATMSWTNCFRVISSVSCVVVEELIEVYKPLFIHSSLQVLHVRSILIRLKSRLWAVSTL